MTLTQAVERAGIVLYAAVAPALALAQEYPAAREPTTDRTASAGGSSWWIWVVIAVAAVAIAWGVQVARKGRRPASGAPTPRGP